MRPHRGGGQSLVESALVFPMLILLSLGVIQVMLYAHARDVLSSAAQEGARLAAEDGRGADEGISRAQDLVSAGLGTSIEPVLVHISVTPDLVDLRIDSELRPILPLPVAGGLPLHAEARVAAERFRPAGGSA
ncbi:MAG: pilus assembly protein [Chloroflexi bacterium]|nr:pilus assembly protein [Chloroflexota bacterium]